MYISSNIESLFNAIGISIKKDQRDIEQLINDIAETHNRNDFQKLHKLLRDNDIYLPIESITSSVEIIAGDRYFPQKDSFLNIKSQLGPNDQEIIKAATKADSSILANGFLRIEWLEFLKIVLKLKNVEGASLEGENAWVWFDKESIRKILNSYSLKLERVISVYRKPIC